MASDKPSIIDLRVKRGQVVSIANEHSIVAGSSCSFTGASATLVGNYLNAKAEPFACQVTDQVASPLVLACDVRAPGQLEAVFDKIRAAWGTLDLVLHSIAFPPIADLYGRVTDCATKGFDIAMKVSCHSIIRMAYLAEPMMPQGGCIMGVSRTPITEYNSHRTSHP